MKPLTSFVLLCVLIAAGPASAMRATSHLDADQRGKVTLPAEQSSAELSLEQPLDPIDLQVAPGETPPDQPRQAQGQAHAAPPVVSQVPEPSGLAMLACGLLLLLLAPYGRNDGSIEPDYVKPDSTL
ncbi:hypothetical protein [Duganella sp.]|uniref:hypothetical protein n=1 Tax=Duganella sp. TaxID=1904440 RepID=UPI0031CF72C5